MRSCDGTTIRAAGEGRFRGHTSGRHAKDRKAVGPCAAKSPPRGDAELQDCVERVSGVGKLVLVGARRLN